MITDSTLFDWATADERAAKHWQPGAVTWGELKAMITATPGRKKESGNYLLGKLRESPACKACSVKGRETCLQRNNRAIVSRNCLVLDADYHPDDDFELNVDLALPGVAYLMHTTFQSAPDEPRWRVIIPTPPLDPEQYGMAARALMQRIGNAYFDHTSDEPARYMFRPAAQRPEWYQHVVVEGRMLDVDQLLDGFVDDLSTKAPPKPHHDKRDPLDLPGIVGEFNRAYDGRLEELIDRYALPYEPATADRWRLVGARSEAGMGEIQGTRGLFYSYHANDPAYGQACSAFDLVRLHKFGEMDAQVPPGTPVNRLPSYDAMVDIATADARVLEEQFGELEEHDAIWQLDLKRHKKTREVLPLPSNYELLGEHDPILMSLRYNELEFMLEATQDLPWRRLAASGGPAITETDIGRLGWYLQQEYGLKIPSYRELGLLVEASARSRWYNPVVEYLNGLRWDGRPRLETCLPGVRDTPYTRMVARKSLVAAVARALHPGCKWDHTLVLAGDEGLGKTNWIETMSRGWFGQLGPLNAKDTLLTLARTWIVVADESHTLRRAEADTQKEFLTRTADVFRAPYERATLSHPRRCVIWGSTNDQVFLQEQQGNRRFLVVQCESRDFARFTDSYVDQVWAEAVQLFHDGERLYLDDRESDLAKSTIAQHVEEDTVAGMVLAYLDDPEMPKNETCTRELWTGALGNFTVAPKRADLLDLFRVMQRLDGWVLLPGKTQTPQYGPQRVFRRIDNDNEGE